jgi:hypothetical protein
MAMSMITSADVLFESRNTRRDLLVLPIAEKAQMDGLEWRRCYRLSRVSCTLLSIRGKRSAGFDSGVGLCGLWRCGVGCSMWRRVTRSFSLDAWVGLSKRIGSRIFAVCLAWSRFFHERSDVSGESKIGR